MHCNYKYLQGKKKDTKCNVKVRDGKEYCSKHKKSVEKNIEIKNNKSINDDPIFNNNVKIPEDASKQKTKKSIFNITINSNKNYYKMSDDEKLNFKKLIEYLFNPESPAILKYLEDATNIDDSNSNLKETITDFKFEVSNSQKLHTHAYLDLTHTGFYKINQQKLREVVNKFLGYTTHINISSQKISSNSNSWSEYMAKNEIQL